MSATRATQASLQRLFELNRSVPSAARYREIEAIEAVWLEPILAQQEALTPQLSSAPEIAPLIEESIADGDSDGRSSADFLANDATREQFRAVVADYAVDGLTEAQNFFAAIPRLPIRAQMAVMRVLIDEFGCGNLQRAHSELYMDLLRELDLPTDLASHLPDVSAETLAFVNCFYWLASRAPDVEYFLGALAYLEAYIPTGFSCFDVACRRLGIKHSLYYSEHIHIDEFHKQELQIAIREYDRAEGCDYAKLWVGMTLLRRLLGDSFDAAIDRARAL
ncbi:MAG TPA: iron-containing redox enzyme family protein [Gaiellaceae bacterium]